MGNKFLDKILKMISNINNITDKKDKIEAIYHLFSYCAYVYYCGYISQKEYLHALMKIEDDPEKIEYENGRDKAIDELIYNNDRLNIFYKRYINLYNNIFIPKNVTYESNISIYKEFIEFLRYLNCDKLYYHLLAKKNISFESIIDHSICVNDREDSYIVINEENAFNRYFVFSHEIAHAYENQIMKDEKIYFDISYNVEIFSILFNRMFMEYLIVNNKINKEDVNLLVNQFEVNYYNFLLQSLFITEIVSSKKYNIFDYDIYITAKNIGINCSLTDHNYAIGNIASLQLINKWRNNDQYFLKKLPELIRDIRNTNLDELINTFDNKQVVTEELKRLTKNKLS